MKKKRIGAAGKPLVCVPLTGASAREVMDELTDVLPMEPDVVEWRADFFGDLSDAERTVDLAGRVKEAAGARPVIFTIRSVAEGGRSALSDRAAVETGAAVCRRTAVEYVDCELRLLEADIAYLRDAAHARGAEIIASFHDFRRTPDRAALREKAARAARFRLDIVKLAVMPNSPRDVLTLLDAALEAKERYGMPVIAVSMGSLGAVSRFAGGLFGSALTFAAGRNASAPGQIPIEELRAVLKFVEKRCR